MSLDLGMEAAVASPTKGNNIYFRAPMHTFYTPRIAGSTAMKKEVECYKC